MPMMANIRFIKVFLLFINFQYRYDRAFFRACKEKAHGNDKIRIDMIKNDWSFYGKSKNRKPFKPGSFGNRGRKRKVPAGISGKKGNTGKLSMVKLLVDYSITGACHAPVNIRQGKVCNVQTRGYRLPDYL